MKKFDGKRLKKARQSCGMNLSEFAEKIKTMGFQKINKSSVWKWEAGTMPRYDYLQAICVALEKTPEFFVH